jgi:hypothetical protein
VIREAFEMSKFINEINKDTEKVGKRLLNNKKTFLIQG